MSTKLYGLVGFPLEHSFSPQYFREKFEREKIDAEYRSFPLSSINGLQRLLETYPEISGLNVTIPYKEEVMEHIDEIDPDAAVTKAVNCIRITGKKTIGYNTDIIGFAQSLSPLLQDHLDKALILGSGGASKAARFVLDKLGIDFLVVSRTKTERSISYSGVTEKLLQDYKLIVNTTPLGMYPNTDAYPEIPYYALTEEHVLFDMVYNPEETKFLQYGRQHGATIKNGMEMLELQAEASWLVWNLS